MRDFLILALIILSLFLFLDWLRLRHRLSQPATPIQENPPPPPPDTSSIEDFTQLLDAFPDPFFSISEQGEILRINDAAQNLFLDRSLLGRNYQSLFLESTLVEEIQEILKQWKPRSATLRLAPNSPFSTHAKGKDSHWEVDLSPLSLSDNSQEIQLMMRDITAGVHTEQVRQDFVANASHELRTPLSIISGYLENLADDEILEDTTMSRKMIDTMSRHVDRINRIVEDMLVISKLESEDGIPLNIEPFAIAPCVRDVVERLELLIETNKAKVTIDIPEITFEGDRFYWTQILFNLVENALKQNASHSVNIEIRGRVVEENFLLIQIHDDGIGIPSADVPFIFKRFYRVEKHHSQTQIKGTGLGLSIVKRAIEAHGGTITAHSTPGIKTTFSIKVPLISSQKS